MAIAVTITAFYNDLDSLTNNKFTGVTAGQKVRYLNRAILNRFIDIKALNPSLYQTNATITASSDTQDLDYPSNIDRGSEFLLYYDAERNNIVPSTDYRPMGDKLHFSFKVASGTSYYIEYTKEPNRYSAVTDTLLESADVRIYEILQTEVETVRDIDLRQGQFSGQAQAAQVRTNQIS